MATSLVAVPTRPRPGGAKWTPRNNVRSSRLREHRIVAVRFRSQCTGQILERREIVYGQEIIDVRQHGADAGGTRLESGIAQQRVQPHETCARFREAIHLEIKAVTGV